MAQGSRRSRSREVAVGDRIFARGKVADDRKSVPAGIIIVMTKADIAQKQDRERAEWQRRGIVGTVSNVNPTTKEVTSNHARAKAACLSLSKSPANGAIPPLRARIGEFSDAKISTFEELKIGDQVRRAWREKYG
ncbi:MAG: hypothetical protein WKF84_21530 [Pyrinomonadaceae bacterium]